MSTLLQARPNGLAKPPAMASQGQSHPGVDWGHPLAQGLKICVPMAGRHMGWEYDYAHHWRYMSPSAGHTGTYSWMDRSRYGGGYTVTAVGTVSGWTYPNSSADLPTAAGSLVIAKRKLDATNRTHYTVTARTVGSGVPISGTNSFDALVPWSDGTVYWDFGGQSGANRLSAAGLTFDDDLWVFTAGPKGSKIIQNGYLRASSSTAISRTTVDSNPIINYIVSGSDNDLACHSLFYVYDRELSVDEANWLTVEPYAMFPPPRPLASIFVMGTSLANPSPRVRRVLQRSN